MGQRLEPRATPAKNWKPTCKKAVWLQVILSASQGQLGAHGGFSPHVTLDSQSMTGNCWLGASYLVNLFFSFCPVKNLSSQLAHSKLTWNLTASSFWSCLATSQDDLTAVTFLWVLRELHLTHVSLLWPICEINRWAQQAVIAVWSLWSNY